MRLKNKMPYIDYLIVMCSIARVDVRINNHNLGNIHNIGIIEFDTTYSKIFKIPKTTFTTNYYEFELPEEQDKLVFTLHQVLKRRGQDFMSYNEWVKEYFE